MVRKDGSDTTKGARRPVRSAKARENRMIDLAIDLAEKQLREGTASSQVISHYLKLASTRNELEKEHLKKKNQLMDAQIESLRSSKNLEELFQQAINAYAAYTGDKQNDFEDV